MFGLVKTWFSDFLEKEENRKQRRLSTQSQLERACVSSSHTCVIATNDPHFRRTTSEMARSIGATVLEARSSHECVEMLSGCVPGILLLGVVLQNSDAVDVIRALSSLNYSGPIQLVGTDSGLTLDVYAIGKRHHLNMLPILAEHGFHDDLWRVLKDHLIVARSDKTPVGKAPRNVDLANALDRGWIEPWYQPKIDIKRRILVGVEALARLNHPEHGIIAPDQFLRNATLESMHKLTEYMVSAAMRDWCRIRETGFVAHVAINVGIESLLTVPFAQLIRETRPLDEDWPGLLLEVTEEQAIKDMSLFHEIATQLRIYGVSFSIDDFGAGYSSLSRLKQVPFSELKLDGSFVKRCSRDERNAGICKAVIDLAHTYEAVATAECVDETDDLVALHKMNCDVAQGYLLCKPLPMDALVSVLMKKSGLQPDRSQGAKQKLVTPEQPRLQIAK